MTSSGGPITNNTVRYNVTIGDGKVTSSRRPTPGQGVLVGFGNLIDESFHHNIAYVENEGDSDVKLVQIDTWTGDNLAFHDNLYIAGEDIRPFDVIDATGTNLQMFNNVYFFANEPREFFWNDLVYTSIDEWRADTGLDVNSQFFIGPFQSRPNATRRSCVERSMRSGRNRPCGRRCSTRCTVSPKSWIDSASGFHP